MIGRLEPEDPDLIKLPIYCYIVGKSSLQKKFVLNIWFDLHMYVCMYVHTYIDHNHYLISP